MLKRTVATMAASLVAAASFATFTPVTSAAALGGNDFIDWSQFGPSFTPVPSGAAGFTNLGLAFTVWSADEVSGADNGGPLTRYDEDNGWAGTFAPGTPLLYVGNSNPSTNTVIKIVFASQVRGVGMQASSNRFGDFNVNAGYWDPYPGNFVGFSSNSGVNAADSHDGSAYTGGYTDVGGITEVYLRADMADGSENLGFGVGQVDLINPVPEPATMAAVGIGIAAVIRRRRK